MASLALLSAAAACKSQPSNRQEDDGQMPSQTIEEVLRQHTEEWMAIRGVVGTGIGQCDGESCIRIMVDRKTDELTARLPKTAGGYRVDIVETGPIRARPQ
jgi:hypothetical protein